MTKTLLTFVSNVANLKVILIFLVLFATALVLVNSTFSTGVRNLTQTFGYTPEKAYEMIETYGETGRLHHVRVLLADIVLVALYTILFSSSIYYTVSRLFPSSNILLGISILPFVLAAIQLLEVIGVFFLLKSYPAQLFPLARVTNILTVIKFILTYVCILTPAAGFLALLVKRLIAFAWK